MYRKHDPRGFADILDDLSQGAVGHPHVVTPRREEFRAGLPNFLRSSKYLRRISDRVCVIGTSLSLPPSITNKNTEVVEIHISKFQLEQLLFPQTCEYKCRERRVIPNAQEFIRVRIVG